MALTRMRIVHLVSSWEHVGALRRIGYTAANLNPAEYEFELVALQARGPDPQSIMAVPLPSIALAAGKRLALPLAWRLRCLMRQSQPDGIHAWDRAAFRVARMGLIGRRHNTRIISTTAHQLPAAIDFVEVQREAHRGPFREKLLAELAIPADARLLGTAGHLTDSKEIIDLLWGLDQIRCVRQDVYLLVIGDGNARPLIERYARLYEIEDYVRFLGWRSDATAILALLDVYCSASVRTSCSLAMLEAMALGIPVVAADTPANRDVIQSGESGFLIDVAERSDVARWCLRILEDPPLAATMSENGRRRAVERFGVARLLAACKKLYGPS
jgi:glycosyltransferase involved in cell wall biosynthesis